MLVNLFDVMNEKALELKDYYKEQGDLSLVNYLDKWMETTNKSFLSLNDEAKHLSGNNLNRFVLRVHRYVKYFDLLAKEDSQEKRCEYTLNYLLDVPEQLKQFLNNYK